MGGIRIPKVNRQSVLVTPLLKEPARLQPQKSVRERQEGGPRGGEVDGAVREVRQREMIQVSGGLRDGGRRGVGFFTWLLQDLEGEGGLPAVCIARSHRIPGCCSQGGES